MHEKSKIGHSISLQNFDRILRYVLMDFQALFSHREGLSETFPSISVAMFDLKKIKDKAFTRIDESVYNRKNMESTLKIHLLKSIR